jgi:hypothetical protein
MNQERVIKKRPAITNEGMSHLFFAIRNEYSEELKRTQDYFVGFAEGSDGAAAGVFVSGAAAGAVVSGCAGAAGATGTVEAAGSLSKMLLDSREERTVNAIEVRAKRTAAMRVIFAAKVLAPVAPRTELEPPPPPIPSAPPPFESWTKTKLIRISATTTCNIAMNVPIVLPVS